MFRQTLSILTASFLVGMLNAQDLHVHYNVFRDSVYYVQQGKTTTAPAIRKGGTVLLHVENYNNYLYDISVKIEEEEIPVASSTPSGLLGQIGGSSALPFSFLFKGGDQSLGGFKFFPSLGGADMKEGSGFATTKEEAEHQAQIARLKKLEADFGVAKDQIIKMDNELKLMQDQVQQKLVAQRLQVFAVEEVNSIRFNPRLEPSQIKTLTGEYMERIFIEKDPNKIDLTQLLKIADAQNELPSAIHAYRKKADNYAVTTGNCELLMDEFRKYDFPQSNLEEFRTAAESFLAAAKNKNTSHQENAAMLESKIPDIQSLDPKTLSELRTTYLELRNNNFSKTYRHIAASGEKINIKPILTPIDSLERKGMKTIELAPVSISVFGGMRVRASVGLNFGQFLQRPQEFFVRDSVLQSGDKDAFLPIMTSFVHFYSPSTRAVSIAGSFGVGFPLGGGENLQSLSFFLGPSLLFGKGERIVLNAGIMGGKAERLAQGYKVGDLYYADSNLAPTSSVYELGYYVGISFNLTGGN